jgi:hypothetical protein
MSTSRLKTPLRWVVALGLVLLAGCAGNGGVGGGGDGLNQNDNANDNDNGPPPIEHGEYHPTDRP